MANRFHILVTPHTISTFKHKDGEVTEDLKSKYSPLLTVALGRQLLKNYSKENLTEVGKQKLYTVAFKK